jgi:hypothetical protein
MDRGKVRFQATVSNAEELQKVADTAPHRELGEASGPRKNIFIRRQ